jgi:formylglycine-generating enzyme required for sulfatase activity
MHGNAWEWCQDVYDADYYAGSPAADPQGPPAAPQASRVMRGGSWYLGASLARSAGREWNDPASCGTNIGFRVVREIEASQ